MRGQIAHREGRPENLLNLARLVRIARCDNQLHARILIFGSSRSSMSSERRKPYPFDQIEPKWQRIWEDRQLFHALNPGEHGFDPAKQKFYILDMFPYPSGAGLHVGHPEGYTATDIIARYKRMRWFNPESNQAEPISRYRREKPNEARLAYVADVPVNWCAELGTVLANEEVVDGKSEIGGFPVVRRPMRQWMLRITKFAERLLNELDGLDWPEGIKLLQRNWIGRSEGAEVDFTVAWVVDPEAAVGDPGYRIRVFTTRPDTLYGATYMVLAPEHSLVDLIVTEEQWPAVRQYRERTARKSELERTDLAKEKTGVFTGAYAINPTNNERIPIWIADYVLLGYGTGAIMAVPAHDERDLEFARKFDLPIRQVVQPSGGEEAIGFTGDG